MRKNPSYTALLRPTHLLISEKSATYTIKWSYTIIWQARVLKYLFSCSHFRTKQGILENFGCCPISTFSFFEKSRCHQNFLQYFSRILKLYQSEFQLKKQRYSSLFCHAQPKKIDYNPCSFFDAKMTRAIPVE